MTDESSTLSEKELKALAHFVVDVSAEGIVGAKEVSIRKQRLIRTMHSDVLR
jgi:hypothetical protein